MINCAPPHPALYLDRPLTRAQMLAALRYEGMFGFEERDLAIARQLEDEGHATVELWDQGRGWHICLSDWESWTSRGVFSRA